MTEQSEIVRLVETLIARLEARVASLTPAALVKACCGELVPQDPNDEPAAKHAPRSKPECDKL